MTRMPESISLAERRVFELAGNSTLSRKEIADRLHLSAACVRAHLTSIYRKMGWGGAGSRIKLLQWCITQENGNHGPANN